MSGLYTRPLDSQLVTRAMDYLAAGPAEPAALVSAVCQQPGTPAFVAEHLAVALLAGDDRFRRQPDGRWSLASFTQTEVSERADFTYTMPAPRTRRAKVAAPAGQVDALGSLSFIVVDVETTGSRPSSGDRITEIGAVVVENGRVLEEERFEQLVNPGRPIPPMITRLTNISWEMVRDQPAFSSVCDRFLEMARGRVFVGHNAAFDWRFVSAEVQRARGEVLHGRKLCTVKLARRLLPFLPRRTLANVAQYYGVDMTAAHPGANTGRHRGADRALVAHTAAGDAVATAHVLLGLLRDARDQHGVEGWGDLEALLTPRVRSKRPKRRRSGPPTSVDRDTTA